MDLDIPPPSYIYIEKEDVDKKTNVDPSHSMLENERGAIMRMYEKKIDRIEKTHAASIAKIDGIKRDKVHCTTMEMYDTLEKLELSYARSMRLASTICSKWYLRWLLFF